MVNRVKIQICGISLNISTPESPDYLLELAAQLDGQIAGIMKDSNKISINDALILAALNYADAFKKSERAADHLRNQLAEYLEDAARTRIELDEARREIVRLRRTLTVHEKNAEAKKQAKKEASLTTE